MITDLPDIQQLPCVYGVSMLNSVRLTTFAAANARNRLIPRIETL
jgi:hypothetical protein